MSVKNTKEIKKENPTNYFGISVPINIPKPKIKLESNSKFPCDVCGRSFKYFPTLKAHLMKHAFKCKNCSRRFMDESKFKSHKCFECVACKRQSSTKFDLELHMKNEHSDELPNCDFCGIVFASKIILCKHILKHIKNAPYECDVCGKKFRGRLGFHSHKTIHKNLPLHECKYCKKKLRSYNIKSHKCLACKICMKVFTRKNYIEDHMNFVHGNVEKRKLSCDLCGREIANKENLMK